jgi:exoribonuclease II
MKNIRQKHKSIYPLLKHEDPTKTTSVFMPDVAKKLFETEEPSYAELYATHRSLADDKIHFVPDSTKHLETATFHVRANRDVLLVARVTNWIRESAPEFEAFLEKSRKLIALSRSLPSTAMPTKLDVEVPSELYFSGNDRNIIEFVTGYVTGRRGFLPTDHYALTPLILKRTGMYPSEIVPHPNRDAARLFLTEIGVWQPSENIPSHMDAGVSMKRVYEEQTATETYDDANASTRHDFGDMPVYTIDDAGAHELDDGISIEQTSEGTWLHIHIANPSAFLPPESHIASLARLRQTTIYLPDRMHPMLPIRDERFSAKGFSKDSQVMPTMTFSARLAGDGNIAEYKVRSGIVHNVKILTYDNVDKAIFPTQTTEQEAWWTPTYTHPDYVAMGKTFDDITPPIAADLNLIEKMIQTHRDWRTSQGALRMKFSGASVHVNPAPLEYELSTPLQTSKTDYAALRKTIPTFVRGQAGIKVTLNNQQARSRRLIEEMMIIAGRIAGKFAQEHQIPVAYRGLSTNIPQSLLEECRSLHMSGKEELPIEVSRRLLSTAGSWMLNQSATPQSHDLLGISGDHGGYVQVTSPMRRYLDILAHWQFESYLRSSALPFAAEDLSGTGEHSLLQASRRVYRRISWSRKVSQFYVASAVDQLFKSPGGIGSTHLEWRGGRFRLSAYLVDDEILGTIYLVPRLVAIKELGVRGMLMLRAGETAPSQGTEFEVEIQEVNVVEGQIVVRLVK